MSKKLRMNIYLSAAVILSGYIATPAYATTGGGNCAHDFVDSSGRYVFCLDEDGCYADNATMCDDYCPGASDANSACNPNTTSNCANGALYCTPP